MDSSKKSLLYFHAFVGGYERPSKTWGLTGSPIKMNCMQVQVLTH